MNFRYLILMSKVKRLFNILATSTRRRCQRSSTNQAAGRHRSKNVRQTQYILGLSYSYDAAMLFGFYLAGYIDSTIPVTFVVLCAICVSAVALAHASAWSCRQADPTLFLPQQLFAISIALLMAVMAPQIAFQPFATLFAICAFGFMAPNTKSFVISWSVGAVGALAVIVLLGPRLEMPTSTAAGQALTEGVVLGLLARCIWIATFVKRLQVRLKEKNRALKEAMERIEALASFDELTNLPNRRAITAWLNEQIMVSTRTGLPLTIALVDVDHFKRINDSFGHQAGDRTLQILSRVAESALERRTASDALAARSSSSCLSGQRWKRRRNRLIAFDSRSKITTGGVSVRT